MSPTLDRSRPAAPAKGGASVRDQGLLQTYREHFAQGRRYSLASYARGSLLRPRCTSAGAVARLHGRPAPVIETGAGEIHIGDVGLYPGVRLTTSPGARITIGDGTYLNRNTLVYAEQSVHIGKGVMISWDVIITDTPGYGECPGLGESKAIFIGDDVWIGAKAVIVAGARIGEGAVIAAGAVVDKIVEAGAVVAARSARPVLVLKRNDHE